MTRLRALIPIAIVFGFAAAGPAEDDLDRLQGDWTTSSFLLDGGPLPKEKQHPDRLMTIKGKAFSEIRSGKVAVRGTIKVDPMKSPPWLDATFEEGGPVGETISGIYKLEGDSLTVCIGTPETPRPGRFESTPGTKLRLIVYKRKRP